MRRPGIFPSLAVLLTVLQLPAPAFADGRPMFALNEQGFQEFVRDGALISGAVVMGVQFHRMAKDVPALSAYVPAEWRGDRLCLRVVSSNGFYQGIAPYDVPSDWSGGFADLDFPIKARHGPMLKGLSEGDLSILLAKGECEGSATPVASVAYWDAETSDQVDLMLNSFRADLVYAYVEGRDTPVKCEKLDEEDATTFDTRCPIELKSPAGPRTIETYRIVGGKPSPAASIVIWFPDP
ncbi:hypothetical protein [Cereibacter sphaeroides]|jgi:hypothetical protein|nr:hypothetical protein [Cereibacter sphaeroides]